MSQETKDALKSYIRQELVTGDQAVEGNTSLFSSRTISSRNLMHLVDFVEKNFGIKVKPMDLVLENFDSVEKIAAYIDRKKS